MEKLWESNDQDNESFSPLASDQVERRKMVGFGRAKTMPFHRLNGKTSDRIDEIAVHCIQSQRIQMHGDHHEKLTRPS